ncbi:hypothetical protein [Chitinophaga eiseniae]|uniref:hypothetical protein n=1 Tax=Chitinophaga eiseniae TaxID=634771 RepID=UPI001356445A|nr:hypothetical protein [Chitinophaga eiseniae]
MESISSKATIKHLVSATLHTLRHSGREAFVTTLHDSLLKKKVRFPIRQPVRLIYSPLR